MKISIVGAGHVGLIAAACLARLGNKITLVDIDKERLKQVSQGVSPIHEPRLAEILSQVDIETTSDYQRLVDSEVIFICVRTPSNDNGSMSLEHIVEISRHISEVLKVKGYYCVIAVKSTVVPGTTETAVIPVLEASGKKAGDDFGVCMDPEFLREGKAVHYYMNPARIIIGELDPRSGHMLVNLYKELQGANYENQH